jgi:NAD(P)-dependent dehydrogenase (short-subunit alcohol dehydrogenase family)
MSDTLAGKRGLVTGAASGIGRAAVELLAERGAAVVAVDVADAVDELAESGAATTTLRVDVADEDAVRGAIAHTVDALGGLDFVFANAGIVGGLAPILELEADDFLRVLRVNLLGVFNCVKHGAPHMIESGSGSIVATASVAGLRAGAGPAHYSASKAAIISLVQNAAAQLTGTGVRVNAICPGLIETNMTRPVFDAARRRGTEDKIGQLNPLQRAGQPVEIARAAAYLISDDASYVNGQALVVDGGLSSSHPFIPGKLW